MQQIYDLFSPDLCFCRLLFKLPSIRPLTNKVDFIYIWILFTLCKMILEYSAVMTSSHHGQGYVRVQECVCVCEQDKSQAGVLRPCLVDTQEACCRTEHYAIARAHTRAHTQPRHHLPLAHTHTRARSSRLDKLVTLEF